MRIILLLFITFFGYIGIAQNKLLNEDGTISNYAKRELLIATFNDLNIDGVSFNIIDNHFVVVSKDDCGDSEFEVKEIQKLAMYSSFEQVLIHINNFKEKGYGLFHEHQLTGMIFKTNVLCMNSTRRYHFKFSFKELENFPEYMDISELIEYVVVKNENKNIILAKNP